MNKLLLFLMRPKTRATKLLLPLFFSFLLVLAFLGYLQPITAFLASENLSFKIGSTQFSLYFLLKAVVTFALLVWLTGLFSDFGEKRISNFKGIKESNKALIIKAFQIFVYCIAAVIGLDILGIDLTSLAIFSGAIGIGVGFGLQKITSNFMSGLILLFEKSIENNDLVELADGTYGFIRHTGARYTRIETFEGKEIMIPNEDFITSRVINWTFSNSTGRVEINIGVSYESDIEKAMELLLEAAKEHPRCVQEPKPTCYLREFADSSVNFLLFFWVADVTEGRFGPKSDVMRSIWKKFKEHNIAIPYPQMDLHLKKANSPR